jgi:hypothetical protein
MEKKKVSETECEEEEWMRLIQDSVQWWVFVNMVLNISWPAKRVATC